MKITELKIDKSTLPQDGDIIEFITHEDSPLGEWRKGEFIEEENMFFINSKKWHYSSEVFKWKPAAKQEEVIAFGDSQND